MAMLAIHPRERLVQSVDRELESFLLELQAKSGLTEAEFVSILARHLSNYARFAIRQERQPDNENKEEDKT